MAWDQAKSLTSHTRGQNSKQINIAKYVSKFLIYGAKMLHKYVKSQKKFFRAKSVFSFVRLTDQHLIIQLID